MPHLVAKEIADDKQIRPVFLIDEDVERIRKVVFSRGLWGDADTYSDDVKEKEVEWALLFSSRLKTEVKNYGYPLVEVEKDGNDFKKVLDVL